jgi:sulfur dioxygenase
MIIQQFLDPKSSTFTYILAKSRDAEAFIIDPVLENVEEYLKFLGENKLRLAKAMDTHIHADHVTGMGKLRELTRCMNLIGEQAVTVMVSRRIKDGEMIQIDGVELKAIYTPGHTNDSYCFYMEGFIFTGDTLFIRGNGRTDFQHGSSEELFESLEKKIFTLPPDTIVYPAHDYKGENISTVGKERKENPRYANKTKEEFIEIMDNLNLPNPKLMDVAVPANQKFGEGVNEGLSSEQILSIKMSQDLLEQALFIDLRESQEISETGKIKGSIHLPYQKLEEVLDDSKHVLTQALASGQKIVLYCAYGERSALGLRTLIDNNCKNIYHMAEGIHAWIKEGGETDK